MLFKTLSIIAIATAGLAPLQAKAASGCSLASHYGVGDGYHGQTTADAANLDQVQIIKGWIDSDGQTHEQIYYVALSDDRGVDPETGLPEPVGSTVDLENVSFSNTIGAVQLSAQWTDPDFDSEQAAFYYARAIEIPRPRWSEYDRKAFDREFNEAPRTVQDRAYSSPIWYHP